jgi:hypothetical protein
MKPRSRRYAAPAAGNVPEGPFSETEMLREIVREVVCAEPDLAVVCEFNDQVAARSAIKALGPQS